MQKYLVVDGGEIFGVGCAGYVNGGGLDSGVTEFVVVGDIKCLGT